MTCTAQLICVFVVTYAGCWFSDAAAHIILCIRYKKMNMEKLVLNVCAVSTLCQCSLWNTYPLCPTKDQADMHHWDITFNTKGVHKQLSQLNTHKATGSDNVRTKRSCETQHIWTLHSIARRLKGVNQVDLVQLDFSKAFDKVPRQRLMYKLQYYGVRGSTAKWAQSFLTNQSL